jgi:hypothetical protein
VPHGLGVAPDLVIVKSLVDHNWVVQHKSLGATKYMYLDTTAVVATATNRWNDTAPDAVNVTLGNTDQLNGTGVGNSPFIMYCFADVKGFSKFGSYIGNGNADGTFVYTGFEPAMVIIKRSDGANSWGMKTAKTQVYNVADVTLFANATGAESAFSGNQVDLLSNGFKIRTTSSDFNTNGGNYIYMAWAKNPIVGSNDIPGMAR